MIQCSLNGLVLWMSISHYVTLTICKLKACLHDLGRRDKLAVRRNPGIAFNSAMRLLE